MRNLIHLVVVAASLMSSLGCRSFTAPARSHELSNGVTWLDYDATRRGALVIPSTSSGNQIHVLSEPSPDVALGVVSEFVAKASYQGINAEASAKVTESIAELGKRTQTIMFLREALFRLNELQTLKSDFTKEDLKEMYSLVLNISLKIAEADREAATADKIRAASESTLPQEQLKSILGNGIDADLQVRYLQLLAKPINVTSDGKTFTRMSDYVRHLVATKPEFKDLTTGTIVSNGGEPLKKLVEYMDQATGP